MIKQNSHVEQQIWKTELHILDSTFELECYHVCFQHFDCLGLSFIVMIENSTWTCSYQTSILINETISIIVFSVSDFFINFSITVIVNAITFNSNSLPALEK